MSFLIHPNNDITTIPLYLLPDWNACCSPTTHGKSFYYRAMSLQNFCYVNLKRSHISCVEWKSHGNLSYPTELAIIMRYFFGLSHFYFSKEILLTVQVHYKVLCFEWITNNFDGPKRSLIFGCRPYHEASIWSIKYVNHVSKWFLDYSSKTSPLT